MNHASIVIPVFNQLHFTKKCLETLLADTSRPAYEVIVIDNGSSDGTKEFLLSEADRLLSSGSKDKIIPIINETNRGVAPAWNQGCEKSTGEYIAVLNNDILLSEGWFTALVDVMKKFKLALVSPFAGTGELSYNFEGKARSFTSKNKNALWASYDFCAVVMKQSTFKELGPFDEKYLVGGYEDTDYAYRMKAKKLRYAVSGAAYIHHFGSQTLGEFKKRGDKHADHNKKYFMEKWGEDPSRFAGTWRGKVLKSWRRFKLRFEKM